MTFVIMGGLFETNSMDNTRAMKSEEQEPPVILGIAMLDLLGGKVGRFGIRGIRLMCCAVSRCNI